VYVVACDDGRGVLYSEDVPDDVPAVNARQTIESDASPDGEGAAEEAAEGGPAELEGEDVVMPRAARLYSVPADAAAAALSEAPMVARRRKRPQLRLVK
jgi:hypothetical protein